MSAPRPTVDEIISTLKRSSDPTLLAEGVDDIVALRRLEDEFYEFSFSIMPLGGRAAVLEVFERRSELPQDCLVLFLADKDLWVHTGVPLPYLHDRLIFTDGYSIENDLYRDGKFERLLTASEKAKFKAELKAFVRWYAIALARKVAGGDAAISTHPAQLLDDSGRMAASTQLLDGEAEPTAELAALEAEYSRILRGKSLMALIIRQLCRPSRPVKHSVRALMEHGSVAGGIWFKRIRDWIDDHLNEAADNDNEAENTV